MTQTKADELLLLAEEVINRFRAKINFASIEIDSQTLTKMNEFLINYKEAKTEQLLKKVHR